MTHSSGRPGVDDAVECGFFPLKMFRQLPLLARKLGGSVMEWVPSESAGVRRLGESDVVEELDGGARSS